MQPISPLVAAVRSASAVAGIAAISVLAATSAWVFRPHVLRVEVGAFDHPFATGAWGRAGRMDIDSAAAAGDDASFYYRPADDTVHVALPFTSRPGRLRVPGQPRRLGRR